MAIETATYVDDLVQTNPLSADLKSTADDHLRLIKKTLLNSFPQATSGPIMILPGASTGSANAYVLTPAPAAASLAVIVDTPIMFRANFTNSGAATLAVSGLTAKAIVKAAGALAAGDIVSGHTYMVAYDGTSYRLVNK